MLRLRHNVRNGSQRQLRARSRTDSAAQPTGPRRLFLSISAYAILALLAACGGSAATTGSEPGSKGTTEGGELTKITVANNFAPTGIVLPLYTALLKGYYEKEGLDVTIEPMKSSQDALNAVNAGRADIANAGVALTIANQAKGIKTVSIGNSVGRHSYGIFLPKDSGIQTLKDLEGKTVLATAGFIIEESKAVFSREGVDVSKIKYATLAPAAIANAFAGGEGDAWLTAVPTGAAVISDARPSRTLLLSDYGVTIPDYTYSVTPDTVKKSPDMIKKFLRATYKGQQDAMADTQRNAEAMVKKIPGLTVENVIKQWESNEAFICSPNAPAGSSVALQIDKDWAYASTFLNEIKYTDGPVDVSGMYTNDLAKDVTSQTCPITSTP